MASAIKAIFDIDISPARSHLADVERIAGEVTGKKAGVGYAKGWRMAGPMFISALRDSFASLASGAPISQVFAQQAPQVLQAFTMIGASAGKVFAGALAAAAIVAAPFIYLWRVGAGAKKLAGEEVSDNPVTRILHLNQEAESNRKLADALRDAERAYWGAAESAKRYGESTAYAIDHARKMLDIAKQMAMLSARTPGQSVEVERNFGMAQLQLSKLERASEIDKKRIEAERLLQESKKSKAEADKIKAPSVESEERTMSKIRADAENAQKKKTEWMSQDPERSRGGNLWGKGALDNGLSGWIGNTMGWFEAVGRTNLRSIGRVFTEGIGNDEEFRGMELETQRQYDSQIKTLDKFLDRKHSNQVSREKKQKLDEEARKKAADARALDLEVSNLEKVAKAKEKAEAEAEESRIAMIRKTQFMSMGARPDLTSNQKIGAYAAPAAMYQIPQQQLTTQQAILKVLQDTKAVIEQGRTANIEAESYF